MPFAPDVAEAFEESLITIVRLVDPPPATGFGRDLSCVLDCTDTFDEVDPDSALGLAQAAVRRLITLRGGVIDAANYGLGITSKLNVGLTQDELRDLPAQCSAEVTKDERIEAFETEITVVGSCMSLACVLYPRDPSLTPFRFVVSVTDAQALIDLTGGV